MRTILLGIHEALVNHSRNACKVLVHNNHCYCIAHSFDPTHLQNRPFAAKPSCDLLFRKLWDIA